MTRTAPRILATLSPAELVDFSGRRGDLPRECASLARRAAAMDLIDGLKYDPREVRRERVSKAETIGGEA
jgi:hypothetical protein